MEYASLLLLLFSVFVGVLATGVGVAFFVGRSSGRSLEQAESEGKLPDRVVKELERCLELRDYVSRDANVLNSAIASQAPSVPGAVRNAVHQLLKTSKTLAGRVGRLGAEARIARAEPDLGSGPVSIEYEVTSLAPASLAPVLTQAEVDAVPQSTGQKAIHQPGPFDDARRFPRSSFRGAAKATIYPRQSGPGRQPLQCDVLTRDLSCGGIGIAHSEQLFPKQIVVLDAVGKLLVGEVRWCRRVDEHFYVAGCRLVKTNE